MNSSSEGTDRLPDPAVCHAGSQGCSVAIDAWLDAKSERQAQQLQLGHGYACVRGYGTGLCLEASAREPSVKLGSAECQVQETAGCACPYVAVLSATAGARVSFELPLVPGKGIPDGRRYSTGMVDNGHFRGSLQLTEVTGLGDRRAGETSASRLSSQLGAEGCSALWPRAGFRAGVLRILRCGLNPENRFWAVFFVRGTLQCKCTVHDALCNVKVVLNQVY